MDAMDDLDMTNLYLTIQLCNTAQRNRTLQDNTFRNISYFFAAQRKFVPHNLYDPEFYVDFKISDFQTLLYGSNRMYFTLICTQYFFLFGIFFFDCVKVDQFILFPILFTMFAICFLEKSRTMSSVIFIGSFKSISIAKCINTLALFQSIYPVSFISEIVKFAAALSFQILEISTLCLRLCQRRFKKLG